MLQRIRRWLLTVLGREDDEEDHRFVPSHLDASVRAAHGGSRDELDREIADIEETAQQLEEQQRQS